MKSSFYSINKNIFLILLAFFFLIVLYFTHLLANLIVPIFIAFFTVMLLYPFIKRLHATRIPNWLSTVIVYLFFLLIIISLITILSISFASFVSDVPEITTEFRQNIIMLAGNLKQMKIFEDYNDRIVEMILGITQTVVSVENFKNFIIKPVGVTLDILKSFGIYALALIFMIPGMGSISDKVLQAFPDERGKKINVIIIHVMEQIQKYVITKSIISLIVGTLSFVICLIFGIKYALLWATIIFLFNFIPIIGSIIAVMFPLMLSVVQYQSPVHFLFLLLFLTAVQVLMGNIIEPKFMSLSINLSPIIILISILVWGYIWGIVGVILSIPIMSTFNLVCENIKPLQPISIFISSGKKKST